MKHKLRSAFMLLFARSYILVTDKTSVTQADFRGLDGAMRAHSLKALQQNLTDLIVDVDGSVKRGRGRPKGSKNRPKTA